MRKKWWVLAALLVTALLIWQKDTLLRPTPKPSVAAQPQRQVLRVWIIEGWVGSTAWAEQQGAVFERAHPGVSLRIRRAQAEELSQPEVVLPDVLLYAPGVVTDPEALFAPLYGELPVRPELAAAGRWRGEQYGAPLAMGGYGLLLNTQRFPSSETSALSESNLRAAATPAKGKQAARYALQCAADGALAYPAALLAVDEGWRGGWPQGILRLREGGVLPADFAQATPDKAYADFAAGQAGALVATQREIRKFSALVMAGKGFDYWVQPSAFPFTDQLLLASVFQPAAQDETRERLCAAWVAHLMDAEAQQALTESGLLPVHADIAGYDPGQSPTLYRLAESLAGEEIVVPNAYTWALAREALRERATMALMQGGVDLTQVVIQ